MPPHCDALDGPVVRRLDAFEKVTAARTLNDVCREVADRYFFETVVRLHRAGEGAPFTGLKPAGLDVGPVTPVAEKAHRCPSRARWRACLRRRHARSAGVGA